jgi:hypothetical protein
MILVQAYVMMFIAKYLSSSPWASTEEFFKSYYYPWKESLLSCGQA